MMLIEGDYNDYDNESRNQALKKKKNHHYFTHSTKIWRICRIKRQSVTLNIIDSAAFVDLVWFIASFRCIWIEADTGFLPFPFSFIIFVVNKILWSRNYYNTGILLNFIVFIQYITQQSCQIRMFISFIKSDLRILLDWKWKLGTFEQIF